MEPLNAITAWLVLALNTWSHPGQSPYSRVVVSECGTDRAHPTCDLTRRVCDEPSLMCAPPRWEQAYRGFTRQENVEEARARYEQIATAVVKVAYAEGEKPAFGGSKGRGSTAALMAATAFEESGMRRDVDFGEGLAGRGDGGASWSLAQVRLDRTGKALTAEGWSGPELVADRSKAFTVELHMIRRSFSACRSVPILHRLAVYTGGTCSGAKAQMRSKDRVGLALTWLGAHPVPVADADVMAAMVPDKPMAITEAEALGLHDDG